MDTRIIKVYNKLATILTNWAGILDKLEIMPTPTPRGRGQDDVIKWKLFRVTGHWEGNSPVPGEFPAQLRGALMFSLTCARINGWVNNRETGDSRRRRAHYDVIVMGYSCYPLENYKQNTPCYRLEKIQRKSFVLYHDAITIRTSNQFWNN